MHQLGAALVMEFKKIPKTLLVVISLFFIMVICYGAVKQTTSELGAGVDGEMHWAFLNETSFTKFALWDFQNIKEKASVVANDPAESPAERANAHKAVQIINQLRVAIRKHNHQRINVVLNGYLQNAPNKEQWISSAMTLTSYYRDFQASTLSISFLSKNKLNASVVLSPDTDASNIIGEELGLWGVFGDWDLSLFKIGVFVVMIILTTTVFSYERRNKTMSLIRISPINQNQLNVIKAIEIIVIVVGSIGLSWVCAVIMIRLMPGGHRFGTFNYPHYYTSFGKTNLITIKGYLGRMLLVWGIWGMFLSGLAFMLNQLGATGIIQAFMMILTVFMGNLGILNVFPSTVGSLLPGTYMDPHDLIFNVGYSSGIHFGFGISVLIAWTVLLWGLGGLAERLKI